MAGFLSNLSNTHPHLHEPYLAPQPHRAPDWRPATINEFNAWNTSPQGMFSSALIGPGQNPDQDPSPHPHPQQSSCTTSHVSLGKWKWTTPSGLGMTPSVGGYGPQSPEGTTTDTSSLSPSPPPFTSDGPRNAAHDVWVFARPLESDEQLPADQWPTSTEPRLTKKPKTPWFGCKLCSQFGCAICLPLEVLR